MSQARPKVLVTERLDEQAARWLGERTRLRWVGHDDAAALLDRELCDAEGLVVRTYTQVDRALLDKAPRLKVVGRAGVGLDNFDLDACRERGVRVVYTPDANTQAVVEYVLGLMLDVVRPRTRLPDGAGAEAFHDLRQTEVGRQLDEMTLGILGFGRIGKRLGRAAHALGMNLLVCDILPEAEVRKAVSYPFDYVEHGDLYAGADIVSVHVDGRDANRRMVDTAAFEQMREKVLFINAARGMLVDAEAAASFAGSHPGATLVLDVHDPEPPPPAPESPLRGLPNVQMLPHLASRTHTALANMSWVVRDVAAVLEGREPKFPAV